MTTTLDRLHDLLHRGGIDVVRYPGRWSPLGRRISLIQAHRINVVLDVGANVGQYGAQLRHLGYKGRIVSFEPLPGACRELRQRSAGDSLWEVVEGALGNQDREGLLNLAGNSVSSSLLKMLPAHEAAAPDSKVIGSAQVAVRRLDSVLPTILKAGDRAFLKIDTQGYERHVLEGAAESLPRIEGIQVELSLVPLYQDGPLLAEMMEYLADHGFGLMSVEPGFSDRKTGRLYQLDGIFFRVPVQTDRRLKEGHDDEDGREPRLGEPSVEGGVKARAASPVHRRRSGGPGQ